MQHLNRDFSKNMKKRYHIFLENRKIGTTKFEKADAPMGVVFGKIDFIGIESGYAFFKAYCLKNNIEISDIPEENIISTYTIEELKVFSEDKNEITGLGNSISGMDADEFEITIVGISYPFYEIEFPNHVKEYNDRFL
jgi:hypothetical protein